MTDGEITVTLATSSGAAEAVSVSPATTTDELREFAVALLGFRPSDPVALTCDGRPLRPGRRLGDSGVGDGDMVLAAVPRRRGAAAAAAAPPRPAAPVPDPGRAAAAAAAAAPGGLDFSSLLGGAPSSSAAAAAPGRSSSAPAAPTSAPASGGNLAFTLPGLDLASAATASPSPHPVEWAGMSLDDAVRCNPNPDVLVPILLSGAHPNLMKELNYHSPQLARRIRAAGLKDGPRVWREEMMKGSIKSAYASTMTKQKEREMTERLRSDPNDEEANKYFGDKIRRENVDTQYRQMMEEYPESMGRVLMLYIDAEVNSHPVQAFVDSGAQSTIMSSRCAEKCGLLHLLDDRFEGVAVGVGTGKILGRVHIAPLRVGGHFFPCTITVMDSEKGLGDKNMDFLFGLDMLKRHRCKVDLEKNALVFGMPDGRSMEAPFLHEKDLDESKGGTRGFDADRSNAEVEKRMEEARRKGEDGDGGDGDGDGDSNGDGGKTEGRARPRRGDDEESGYEGGVESEVMDVDETDKELEGGRGGGGGGENGGNGDGGRNKPKKRPNEGA